MYNLNVFTNNLTKNVFPRSKFILHNYKQRLFAYFSKLLDNYNIEPIKFLSAVLFHKYFVNKSLYDILVFFSAISIQLSFQFNYLFTINKLSPCLCLISLAKKQ